MGIRQIGGGRVDNLSMALNETAQVSRQGSKHVHFSGV